MKGSSMKIDPIVYLDTSEDLPELDIDSIMLLQQNPTKKVDLYKILRLNLYFLLQMKEQMEMT